jgi:hypothetical protein
MQLHLDTELVHYNHERPRQSGGMKGRAPIQVFLADLKKAPQKKPAEEEKATA